MAEDFAAREDAGFTEIGYKEIQNYHDVVFENNNLGRDAWTATAPLDIAARHYEFLGYSSAEEAQSAVWDAMVEHGFTGQAAVYWLCCNYCF